jgi:AcrR family transcriptional regulator
MAVQQLQSAGRSPGDTRLRIMAAARTLLAAKGRRGTTTREIAELAGVNEATLFRHFGQKDALIEACVEHYCSTIELEELLGSLDGDLERDLQRIGAALLQRMESVRDIIVMSLVEEESQGSVGDAAWRAPTAIKKIVAEYMAKRVAAGELRGDPALLARFFMGMIFSYVMGRRRFPDEYPADPAEAIAFQIGVFLDGSKKRS